MRGHRRGRVRKHQLDELMVLANRAVRMAEEISAQPRLMVALDHNRDLKIMPLNEAGVVAVNIIQMWLKVAPRVELRVGDSITLSIPIGYPSPDDSDSGETSGDRRDIERAGSPVEGEGGEELPRGFLYKERIGYTGESWSDWNPARESPQA